MSVTATIGAPGKIHIRGPYNESMQEFYGALPAANWSKKLLCWTCDLTPASAWMLASCCPSPIEVSSEIERMATEFYEPILRPKPPQQPEIRVHDAWAHQAAAYTFFRDRLVGLADMYMATGKSKVATDLANNVGVRSLLIMCPVAVMGVWRRELERHSPTKHQWVVHIMDKRVGSSERKARYISDVRAMADALRTKLAIVINYESIWREPLASEITRHHWDMIIGDELHRIKGPQSAVSKYCAKLRHCSTRRLGLTGTPMAHSPMDLFAQFRFLDPGIYGSSYHRFRSRYAISGHFGADHIVGFKNQEELARRMSLITFSVGKEVLDLPPVQHIEIPITLEPKTRRQYDTLEAEAVLEVAKGTITAANALVRMLRLSQVTGGFCMVDDDGTVAKDDRIVEFGTEKEDTLADLLEDLNEPVVVACRYTRDLSVVRRITEKLGRRYGEVSGQQKDLTEHATMPEDIDVMGVQVASGGVGIDLQRARVILLFSISWSLGDYEQLLARVHRPGQTRNVVYYHLVAEQTVDQTVYQALRDKRVVIDAVLDYMRAESRD